jgi:hypothetical protein
MKKIFGFLKKVEWEAVFWIIGLGYLFFINPYTQQHFTLCPFNNLGIDFCPGCGLGKSISLLYYGDIINSLKTHPLGIFALIIIVHRIISLLNKNSKQKREDTHGKSSRFITGNNGGRTSLYRRFAERHG